MSEEEIKQFLSCISYGGAHLAMPHDDLMKWAVFARNA
jgi:hypothetical protein